MLICNFVKVSFCLSRFSYVNSIGLADYLSNIMSKPRINFRYDGSLSPRSITEIQKGPLRINNLVDSLNNPKYEQIKLKSSQQIEQPAAPIDQKKNANGEETSIMNNANKIVRKDSQVASNASRTPINSQDNQRTPHKPIGLRLKQYQSVLKEPAQSDFGGLSPIKMNLNQNKDKPKEPKRSQSKKKEEIQFKPITEEKTIKPTNEEKAANPSSQEKQAKPKNEQKPIKPTNQEKNIRPNNEEKPIKPTNDQKDHPQVQQLPYKPKYTFTIAPPPPLKKTEVCCNLFGWCKKEEKQRTYPIND